MLFDLNRFLFAVSTALDFVEMDILGATANHTRRVAYISLMMGKRLRMTDEELFDLVSLAILHDNGLCEEVLFSKIDREKLDRLSRMEGYKEHCLIGENNIAEYPFRTQPHDIVKYHHENWNGTGFFKMMEDEIPLMAQIIALADYVDNRFHFEVPALEHRRSITQYIQDNRGKRFSYDMVECFMEVSGRASFWFDLRSPFVEKVLPRETPSFVVEMTPAEILGITRVFSRIIDSKSKFTARHSTGLIDKADRMARHYAFDEDKRNKFAIAASLHDIGKLAVPNSIIDKRGQLDIDQYEIMKSHTYLTRAVLEQIPGFEEITEWAANHHEKLNGAGYPYGFKGERLDFESRLMTCLDIYQALTEQRPYRDASHHDAVMSILRRLGEGGYIDADIVEDIGVVFGSK